MTCAQGPQQSIALLQIHLSFLPSPVSGTFRVKNAQAAEIISFIEANRKENEPLFFHFSGTGWVS